MTRRIYVRTPSRLHFGLTSLGHDPTRPQFGGVGAMIDRPGIELEISPANDFTAVGPLKDRVVKFAGMIAEQLQLAALPEVKIEVLAAPREHTGLGVGTQLGLGVAAGIAEALGIPWRDPVRLVQLTRRGRRSAVGTFGFFLGGLIVDGGHMRDEPLGDLNCHCEVPDSWRFVLVTPRNQAACAGQTEDRLIDSLPPVAESETETMENVIQQQMLPAIRARDFPVFSEALFEFGCRAGKCFEKVQGGTYSSPGTANLISWLRQRGVTGVGQSSWGPTVFALQPDEQSAKLLNDDLSNHPQFGDLEVAISAPTNSGAIVESRP